MNADAEKEQKESSSTENEKRDEKEEQDEENKEVDPTEPELLKRLPPEAKKVLEFGMSMHRFGPLPNPIAEKINERHR